MVDSNNLTDFPREGHSENQVGRKTVIKRKRKDDDLFKTRSEETKPKKTRARKKKVDDEEDEIAVIEELNVRSLPVNSIVLGCIQEIREFEMKMSLPGDIQCVIPITNISELYTEALQNFADDAVNNKPPLKPKSMFKIGECYPVKVVEKQEDNHTFQGTAVTRIHVIGSLDPKDIYEEIVGSTFAKCCNNLIMSAVVASIEDHGYIMDIGIEGLKAFLSTDDSEPFLEKLNVNSLSIGQLTLCEVKSCDKRIVKLGFPSKKSRVSAENPDFSVSCLLPGVNVTATVMDVSDNGLHVMVLNEFKGFVHKNHLKTVWDLPSRDYKIADNIKGTILYRNPLSKLVAITLGKTLDPQVVTQTWTGIRVGQIIKKGTVVGKDEHGTVVLKFKKGLKAVIPKSQLSDEFLTQSEFTEFESKLEIGTNHKFRIKSICYLDGYAKGTLKPSILSKGDLSVDDIEVGAFLTGKVKRMTNDGLVLQLGYNIQGFVPKIHLAETANVPNPEKLYPLDKEVKCRVIRIDKNVEPPKISVTCKKSLMKKNLLILDFFNKAEVGMETDGVIALINEYGLLIEFFNGVRGFAPLNLLSEAKITNAQSLFKVGQIVHCYVVSSLPTKRKMILSLIPLKSNEQESPRKRKDSASDNAETVGPKKLKKSTQPETIVAPDQVSQKKMKERKVSETRESKTLIEVVSEETPKQKKEKRKQKDIEEEVLNNLKALTEKAKKSKTVEQSSKSQSEKKKKIAIDADTTETTKKSKKEKKDEKRKTDIQDVKNESSKQQQKSPSKQCLPVKEGFIWDEEEQKNEESDVTDSSDQEEEKEENKSEKKKKSRKERNEEAQKREEYLRKREEVLMDKERPPETTDDFERLVISSPNSSIVWIHYISFHLDLGEVDKARTIAERALVTISFREEKEKFNIWVALLNLENEYGDSDSFNAVFTRALQMNDQLKVYNHVVKIYENSNKLKEAEQMHELMCRKFKKQKEVFISFAVFLMKHNDSSKARSLLDKALNCLEMREHVDVISKFAQIEFQFGEFERAKTMFENLISNYPKRVDLWSIFIDMMIKYGHDSSLDSVSSIRSVFERAITLKLPVKKMRTMFKKYLDFESKHGNEDTVARIKQKAKEYVDHDPFKADDE